MTTIKLKNGSGAPTAGDLVQGEPALDLTNKRLYTEDSGGTVIEVGTNPGTDVTFADNRKAVFGAGSDLQIYHNGNHSFIEDSGTGNLYIRGTNLEIQSTAQEKYLAANANGGVKLYYDNAEKLATTSTGIDVTGNATFDDNGKAVFGAGSDLEIYHESSTGRSFIKETGADEFRILGSDIRIKNGDDSKTYMQMTDGGSVAIRHNDGTKLETTSSGIDVTGTVTADGLTVDGVATISSAIGDSFVLNKSDGSGSPNIIFKSGGTQTAKISTDGTNAITFARGTTTALKITGGTGDISFYEDTGTTAKLFWDASAESLGIGTSSPSSPLEVAGGSAYPTTKFSRDGGTAATQGYLTTGFSAIGYSGGTGADAYLVAEHGFGFAVNAGTNALVITDGGNVGIGTDSPDNKLHVYKGASGHSWSFDGGDVFIVENNDSVGINLATPSANSASILFSDDSARGQGRIIYDHASDYMGFHTSGISSERMRIDSSGNLLVGTTTTTAGNEGMVYFNGSSLRVTRDSDEPLNLDRLTTNGTIAAFKKDGTTVGSIGVDSGDNLYIGSSAASHGGLYFGTNTAAPLSAGTLTDDVMDLGTATYRFDDVYATNGTIQTSDRNEKQDIEALSEAEQRVAVACKGLLRKFRWKSSVEENGDDARIHFGIIAQDLQAAFEAEGLDAGRYAMFISTTWTDEETGEERTRMGVRYSELLAFIIAAI